MTNGAKIDQKITLDCLEWEVMKTKINSKTTANILSVLCHLYYSLSHQKKPAIWDFLFKPFSVQFSSVAQSCPTLCDPMNCSTPGLPVHHKLLEFTQTQVHRVSDTIQHLIPWRPLLLPSIPPSIRVFSKESAFHMRWPKYWSFSFSVIPSKEIPGLISFRMDWMDLLAVQGTICIQEFLNTSMWIKIILKDICR